MFSSKAIKGVLYNLAGSFAELLSAAGSLSSLVSGVTFAAANHVDQEVEALYYAEGNVNATMWTNLNIRGNEGGSFWGFPMHINFADEFVHSQQLSEEYVGAYSINLTDYISSTSLQNIGSIALAAGVCLKVTGGALKVWVRSLEDQLEYPSFSSPTLKEYLHHAAADTLCSLSTAAISTTVVESAIRLNWIPINKLDFTYPAPEKTMGLIANASRPLNVITGSYPIRAYSLSTDLPQNHELYVHTDGGVNYTISYGAAVSIHETTQKPLPAIIPTIGATLYPVGRFFKTKAELERLKRVAQLDQNSCGIEEDSKSTISPIAAVVLP